MQQGSRCSGDPADLRPRLVGPRPCGAVPDGGDVAAAKVEEVVDLAVGEEEALDLPRRLEALHLPFSSSCRLVRIFYPVVETLVPEVLQTRHQFLLRCGCRACR